MKNFSHSCAGTDHGEAKNPSSGPFPNPRLATPGAGTEAPRLPRMTKEQLKKLETDLWTAADKLRANSGLKPSAYSTPVLGIIFLKFADSIYGRHEADIHAEFAKLKGSRREKPISEIAIAQCGFYLPDHARYDYLLNLPESRDIAKALKEAFKAVEEYKQELEGVLPADQFFDLRRSEKTKTLPNDLLRVFKDIPKDVTGDLFGQIYEYFLAEFARSEGQKGGEFFTPRSVVRLMVEIIEPHGGRVFDPACGSGGMFVQSKQFIDQHRRELAAGASDDDVFVCGQEKEPQTVGLAKMNLALNGLRGEIKEANTYYDDPHKSFGAFDYVLANPPFNVDEVSLKAVEKDPRFNTHGLPRNKSKVKKADEGKETVPNANYLWINLFATSLKPKGRAALVMANSASDARHSEADIRRTLIEKNLIAGMLTLPSNMFYTVTLPATLWFFDGAKPDDRILFIDARNVFTQIDRAHREFSDEQVANLALISHLRHGRRDRFVRQVDRYFATGLARLRENAAQVAPVTARLLDVLDDAAGKDAVARLVAAWHGLAKLEKKHAAYLEGSAPAEPKSITATKVDSLNRAQHTLRAAFDPFFTDLHAGLKHLDATVRAHEKAHATEATAAGKRATADRATRQLKEALEQLHAEVKHAESSFTHIRWLQDRFPDAAYEDVTGLCKLATPAEVAEQEFSLNPGRYVGVVIEEDGKTEKEFIEEMRSMHEALLGLNNTARDAETVITGNIRQIIGES
jgi:type I restriction enzyme M protein